MTWFLTTGELATKCKLDQDQIFAGIFAAVGHDVDHPGRTNAYLTAIGAPLATRYNDAAVLESHHCATLYQLATQIKHPVFERCDQGRYSRIREHVVAMILSTDMAGHFTKLANFKSRRTSNWMEEGQEDKDQKLALCVALHAADLSNPAKPLDLYYGKWLNRILAEFFEQGDHERSRGLPVTPLMDRTTVNVPKMQVGFINVLVFPLYVEFQAILPELQICCDNIRDNIKYWEGQIAAEEAGEPPPPATVTRVRSPKEKARTSFGKEKEQGRSPSKQGP
jgi:cAMP-specific phosphodiesterase 4